MKYTVKRVRQVISDDKPRYKYSAWTTARRKMVYGFTEASVRRQLVTINFLGRRVAVHKKVAPKLIAAHKEVRAREKEHGWKPFIAGSVQCFNWRTIRGGTSLSRHAHAIAIDIDPAKNPSYPRYNSTITMQIPIRVVQALRNQGFQAGLEWNSPCDTMHFQLH